MTISYEDDFEYANSKLSGSIVYKSGQPVHINYVDVEEGDAFYQDPQTREERVCELSALDLTPVKLGYVNYPEGASYLSRIPARHWRQGLRENTVSCNGTYGGVYNSYFISTVLGAYPTFTHCLEQCKNTALSIAFSRNFALFPSLKGIFLYFKGEKVGVVDETGTGSRPKLNEEYTYLQEMLEGELNANYS